MRQEVIYLRMAIVKQSSLASDGAGLMLKQHELRWLFEEIGKAYLIELIAPKFTPDDYLHFTTFYNRE